MVRFEYAYPQKLREKLIKEINFTTFKIEPSKLCGDMFFIFFSISFIASILWPLLFLEHPNWFIPMLVFLSVFLGSHFLFYLVVIYYGERKAELIEKVLPDVLQLLAVNLKSGYTLDKSIKMLTKEEFGPLDKELKIVEREVALGKELSESLIRMSEKIKSEKFKKAIKLIVFSLESGGELSPLCLSLSEELENEEIAQEKMKAEVHIYVILIFIAITLCAAVLLGISSVIAHVFETSMVGIEMGEVSSSTSMLFRVGGSDEATAGYFFTYSLIYLIINNVIGALSMGFISKGKASGGYKYIAPMVITSIIVFIITRNVIGGFLLGSLS